MNNILETSKLEQDTIEHDTFEQDTVRLRKVHLNLEQDALGQGMLEQDALEQDTLGAIAQVPFDGNVNGDTRKHGLYFFAVTIAVCLPAVV